MAPVGLSLGQARSATVWTVASSSRTSPGHGCSTRKASALSDTSACSFRGPFASAERKAATSTGMSSRRSRREGR